MVYKCCLLVRNGTSPTLLLKNFWTSLSFLPYSDKWDASSVQVSTSFGVASHGNSWCSQEFHHYGRLDAHSQRLEEALEESCNDWEEAPVIVETLYFPMPQASTHHHKPLVFKCVTNNYITICMILFNYIYVYIHCFLFLIYIYIYLRVYSFWYNTLIYIYMYIYICKYVYIYIYTCVCECVCIHICMSLCVNNRPTVLSQVVHPAQCCGIEHRRPMSAPPGREWRRVTGPQPCWLLMTYFIWC